MGYYTRPEAITTHFPQDCQVNGIYVATGPSVDPTELIVVALMNGVWYAMKPMEKLQGFHPGVMLNGPLTQE